MPGIELESNLVKYPYELKSNGLVESDTSLIWQRNAGICRVKIQIAERFK